MSTPTEPPPTRGILVGRILNPSPICEEAKVHHAKAERFYREGGEAYRAGQRTLADESARVAAVRRAAASVVHTTGATS